jgi:tetratricopeptide (TPR) repeat protein
MSNPITEAQALEAEGKLAEAIQAYDDILNTTDGTSTLALAHFRLGAIYQGWRELFTAQRFFAHAHQLDPTNTDIRDAIAELNQHFSENREAVADEMSRKNSDQIVSLFRIATGVKLLTMDKPVQAYPLLKSRTKIFPNAAMAKHLLTDIQITEDERNSAINFLLERDWLVNTGALLYTITEKGLYNFYIELAQLHIANAAWTEAVMCYEQAYWLDPGQAHLRYQIVICHTGGEAWDKAVGIIAELSTEEVPEAVDPVAYHTAVAQSYHHVYQTTEDAGTKQKVIEACEAVLRLNKKAKEISRLLASYQGKKAWWRR